MHRKLLIFYPFHIQAETCNQNNKRIIYSSAQIFEIQAHIMLNFNTFLNQVLRYFTRIMKPRDPSKSSSSPAFPSWPKTTPINRMKLWYATVTSNCQLAFVTWYKFYSALLEASTFCSGQLTQHVIKVSPTTFIALPMHTTLICVYCGCGQQLRQNDVHSSRYACHCQTATFVISKFLCNWCHNPVSVTSRWKNPGFTRWKLWVRFLQPR